MTWRRAIFPTTIWRVLVERFAPSMTATFLLNPYDVILAISNKDDMKLFSEGISGPNHKDKFDGNNLFQRTGNRHSVKYIGYILKIKYTYYKIRRKLSTQRQQMNTTKTIRSNTNYQWRNNTKQHKHYIKLSRLTSPLTDKKRGIQLRPRQ